jgi:hypothetical protein
MEDEWVLKIFSPQELRAAVDLAYPERVAERLCGFVRWEKLPTPIWVLILRRLWRKSRTNMLVCKAWREIVMHNPEYWRLAYVERLQPFPSNFPKDALDYFTNSFHTFDDEFFPTFYAKVGWLYPNGHPSHPSYESSCLDARFTIDTNSMMKISNTRHGRQSVVEFKLSKKFSQMTQTYIQQQKLSTSPLVIKVCYTNRERGCMYAKQANSSSAYFQEIRWIDKTADLCWYGTGQAKDNDDASPIPDGDGVWSRFSTGEVLLQGKGVAYRGFMDDDGVTYHRGKRVKTE